MILICCRKCPLPTIDSCFGFAFSLWPFVNWTYGNCFTLFSFWDFESFSRSYHRNVLLPSYGGFDIYVWSFIWSILSVAKVAVHRSLKITTVTVTVLKNGYLNFPWWWNDHMPLGNVRVFQLLGVYFMVHGIKVVIRVSVSLGTKGLGVVM